jgi:curved DNA-binding protein
VATTRDFYEMLGVARTASQEEIQRAYRKLARRFHPDINKDPDAEDRFKEINEAYQVLSDPESRARYDRFGQAWRQVPEDYDPTAAGPFGGRGRTGQRVHVNTGGFNDTGFGDVPFGAGGFGAGGFGDRSFVDVEDLLGGLFGGGFGGRAGRVQAPGADTEAEIELSVEEAYTGGRSHVTLSTHGGGIRGYDVTIPPGATDGQRIRLAGQGASGLGGGPRGDLYLVVRLAPHPRYRVDGRDITVDLPVAPWEAALGAKVAVDTPGGPAQVRVPAGSPTGRRLRLRGRGLPNLRGAPGDLYAEVKIVVPATSSPAERDLWQKLAKVSGFDPRREHADTATEGRR